MKKLKGFLNAQRGADIDTILKTQFSFSNQVSPITATKIQNSLCDFQTVCSLFLDTGFQFIQ